MGMTISVPLDAIDAWADGEASACEEAARPAAQAAVQVLYDAVKTNVAGIKRHTGNLDRSIYQVYSKSKSGTGMATYHVSWNARKAPHGRLVEFGHVMRYEVTYDPTTHLFTTHKDRPLPAPRLVAAKPFVRPAIAQFDQAMAAAKAEFFKRLDERNK